MGDPTGHFFFELVDRPVVWEAEPDVQGQVNAGSQEAQGFHPHHYHVDQNVIDAVPGDSIGGHELASAEPAHDYAVSADDTPPAVEAPPHEDVA